MSEEPNREEKLPPPVEDAAPPPYSPSYIEKLIGGELGLATTYWVYGVLAGFIWAAAMAAARPENFWHEEDDLQKSIRYSFIGYYILIYIAIWNAASKYTGSKVWSILAKFLVVLTCVTVAVRLVSLTE
jgi:hypothetical protein